MQNEQEMDASDILRNTVARSRLDVTSRPVVWLFFEQFWFEFVPVFHGLQGRFAAQG
jgi:hypothetical protein